jgi:hypothetical protein
MVIVYPCTKHWHLAYPSKMPRVRIHEKRSNNPIESQQQGNQKEVELIISKDNLYAQGIPLF